MLDSSLITGHLSLLKRAVSSVVERLVYTERVGGSKPSPPSLLSQRGGERRLSRQSFSEGGPFLPCNVNAASFDSACQSEMKTFTYVYILQSEPDSRRFYIAHSIFATDLLVIIMVKCRTPQNGSRGESKPTLLFQTERRLKPS